MKALHQQNSKYLSKKVTKQKCLSLEVVQEVITALTAPDILHVLFDIVLYFPY